MTPFQYSGANFTGIRLLNPENHFVQKYLLKHLRALEVERVEDLKTEEALMFDAVAFTASAIKDLAFVNGTDTRPLDCYGEDISDFGSQLKEYMRLVRICFNQIIWANFFFRIY